MSLLRRFWRWLTGKSEWNDNPVTVLRTDWTDNAHVRVLTDPTIAYPPYGKPGIDVEQMVTDDERALMEALEDRDAEWTSIEGTPGVTDITDLDVSDLDELRRIYGSSPFLTDADLQRWAAEAKADYARRQEIEALLRAIPTDLPEPPDDGYRPAGGPTAGTSPSTGIVYPPKVADQTTEQWVSLRLEQAYGPGGFRQVYPSGYSMRYLVDLKRRAERRDSSLSAYELQILRSRGLV